MSTKTWQLAEFERIATTLRSLDAVRSVCLKGSVAEGTHDHASDLDIGVAVRTPIDPEPFLALFSEEQILGQERYLGADSALLRILLLDGRQYDIELVSREDGSPERTKAALPKASEFWFVLHAAHHALLRNRQIVALDLVFYCYRMITQEFWNVGIDERDLIHAELESLDLQMNEAALRAAILHLARLGGIALDDAARSEAFAQIVRRRTAEFEPISQRPDASDNS